MTAQAKPEQVSVQTVCNALAKSKLLPPDQVRSLFQRWNQEGKAAAGDVEQFRRWLVANRFVTDYQAERLSRGQSSHYFLNQYKLLDRIGQGRMAGVYKAQHQLGTIVAVKVLPLSKARDPQAFGRFQREARLARKLKHPNIVRTFQMGEFDGLHYIVMEHLEGEVLKDVLQRRGPLPPAEAVRLVHQALMGLQEIHARGMVHRDLEPGNLMLVPGWTKGKPDDTSNDTLKILDIGLGRALFDEDNAPGGQDFTTDGTLLGKPEYLAPEQAKSAHTSDIRADIYSLGCVLYHCLAGRPPFVEAQPVRLLVKHAREAPPPVKQFNPQVPDGLQKILDWMLAKDPTQRYPTPERAAQAMQVFLASANTALQSPEADPVMQPYLQWLSADAGNDDVEIVPAPVAPPAPAAAPPMMEAPHPPAPPLPAEVAAPDAASPWGAIESVPAGTPNQPASSLLSGFSKRDVIMMALGAGGMLLIVVLILIIKH
jgi:serine/threonine protein kinase